MNKRPVCLCTIVFLIFIFSYNILFSDRQEQKARAYEQQIQEESIVTVYGRINRIQEKYNQWRVLIQACQFEQNGKPIPDCHVDTIMAVCDEPPKTAVGTYVKVTGCAAYFEEATNPGMFDARAYYEMMGVSFQIKDAVILLSETGKRPVTDGLYQLQQRVRTVYENELPQDEAGVLCAMALGDKTLLTEETRELYSSSGISHILAISGLHISLLGMGVYRLLRRLTAGVMSAGIASAIFVCLFGLMAGMSASTVRAIIMYVMLLASYIFHRSYDALTALSLAAVFLVLGNPRLLFYSGFLLSFVAAGGALAGAKVSMLYRRKKYAKLYQTVIVSLMIHLFTIPLLMWFYYEIPTYSVLLNFIVLPWMSVLLVCALAGGGIGLWSEALAEYPLQICHYILSGIEKLAEWTQTLPFAVIITGRPSIFYMILYYTACILFLCLIVFMRRDASKLPFLRYELCIRLVCLSICFLFLIPLCPKYHHDASFVMLDVGQGEGIFAQTKSGISVCIDGGSSSVYEVGERRLECFLKYNGVRKIDYWFVSHTDTDHISGLMELLEGGYPVSYLVLAKGRPTDEQDEALVRLAKKQGIRIVEMEKGDCLNIGRDSITCLAPDSDFEGTDKNEASLVLKLRMEGVTVLCTGDIGEETEETLVIDKTLLKADVLKAAHHGSKYSNSEAFLQCVAPKTVLISAGKGNRYGHPAKETIARIEDFHVPYFCTASDGAVVLKMKDGTLQIE